MGPNLEPYFDHLRGLPSINKVSARLDAKTHAPGLSIRVGAREFRLPTKLSTTHLSEAVVAQVRSEARTKPGLLLLAPLISDELAQQLNDANINYLDQRGNVRLHLGKDYLVWIVGRRGPTATSASVTDIRYPGYRVMFAYLAKPELIAAPLRSVAMESGTSVTAVSAMLERMRVDGMTFETKNGAAWAPGQRKRLLERWLAAYPVQVRTRLLVGTFRVPAQGPDEIEAHVASALGDHGDWQLTGTSAAWKMNRHYRGSRVSLQIGDDVTEVKKLLRAVPDSAGDLILLHRLGPQASNGVKDGLAHPLLVYSELMTSGDDRAVETAELLFENAWQE